MEFNSVKLVLLIRNSQKKKCLRNFAYNFQHNLVRFVKRIHYSQGFSRYGLECCVVLHAEKTQGATTLKTELTSIRSPEASRSLYKYFPICISSTSRDETRRPDLKIRFVFFFFPYYK